MLRINVNLGGLEYCEHLIRGENYRTDSGVGDSIISGYDGATDHLWFVYDVDRTCVFTINDPGTYDGSYGCYFDGVLYESVIRFPSDGIVYGINTSGATAIPDADLPDIECVEVYYQNLYDTSEVVICGVKNLPMPD